MMPVILPEELRELFPIPPAVLNLREERARAMTQEQTDAERFVLTHLDALRGRVDNLQLNIRPSNDLQNADIQYIWQLCRLTEDELCRLPNLGRRNRMEIKEALAELDLSLGMTFSAQSLFLLNTP